MQSALIVFFLALLSIAFGSCTSGTSPVRVYVKFTSGTSSNITVYKNTTQVNSFSTSATFDQSVCLSSADDYYVKFSPATKYGQMSFVLLVYEDSEVVTSDSQVGWFGQYEKKFKYRRVVEAPTAAPTFLEDSDSCDASEIVVRLNALTSEGNNLIWNLRPLDSSEVVARGHGDTLSSQCASCGKYVLSLVSLNGNGLGASGAFNVSVNGNQVLHLTSEFQSGNHYSVFVNVPCTCNPDFTQFRVILNDDTKPDETSWTLFKTDGVSPVLVEFKEASKGGNLCLENGQYQFEIVDSDGDGICCQDNDSNLRYGQYALYLDNQILNNGYGGEFGYNQKHAFTVSKTP
jgi:hypothetical protein